MSELFQLHVASSLCCPIIEGDRVIIYGPLNTLKFEPGRILTVATGTRIRKCDQSGHVKIVPSKKYADRLAFTSQEYGPHDTTTNISVEIKNISSGFVRIDPTDYLFKYVFMIDGCDDEPSETDCTESLANGPTDELETPDGSVAESPLPDVETESLATDELPPPEVVSPVETVPTPSDVDSPVETVPTTPEVASPVETVPTPSDVDSPAETPSAIETPDVNPCASSVEESFPAVENLASPEAEETLGDPSLVEKAVSPGIQTPGTLRTETALSPVVEDSGHIGTAPVVQTPSEEVTYTKPKNISSDKKKGSKKKTQKKKRVAI